MFYYEFLDKESRNLEVIQLCLPVVVVNARALNRIVAHVDKDLHIRLEIEVSRCDFVFVFHYNLLFKLFLSYNHKIRCNHNRHLHRLVEKKTVLRLEGRFRRVALIRLILPKKTWLSTRCTLSIWRNLVQRVASPRRLSQGQKKQNKL